MRLLRRLFRRVRGLVRAENIHQEIDEEARFHFEMRIEENMRRGMSPEEARRDAERRFGNLTRMKERGYEVRGGRWLETLWQDLRYGVRMLLKRPGFTLIAVLTLSLGIGANTAIFSMVNGVLLRPLPYRDPSRLVAIQSGNPQSGQGGVFGGVSPADFLDFKEQSRTIERLAAYRGWSLSLPSMDHPESIVAPRVSGDFFAVFGVEPLLGRGFTQEEELSTGPRAVVLSHRLWQQRFGGDPSIVGRTIETTDGLTTVAGVMPPSFKYPNYAEAWLPMPRDGSEMKYRANRYFGVVGRIKTDQTLDTAQAEIKTIARRLEAEYPKDNQNWTARLVPWRDYLVGGGKEALLILMGAVGLVLLIACVNVANLLLARAASRRKEMAIRLAIGASRLRLMRQLLVESVLLALLGGSCGLLLAARGVDVLVGMMPALDSPFVWLSDARSEVHLDRFVLLFTLLVSVVTGIIFGLVPCWQATRPAVGEWLKEDGLGAEGSRHQRTRGALVVAEMALALVLLAGAGLLAGSFLRMLRVDLGYNPRGLMTMPLPMPQQNRAQFARQVLDEVARVHGVQSVSLMSFWTFGGLNFPFNLESSPLPSGDVNASYSAVSPDYFRTLKAQLRAGREFNDRDGQQSPSVAIINETLKRQFFAGEDPLGKKIVIIADLIWMYCYP